MSRDVYESFAGSLNTSIQVATYYELAEHLNTVLTNAQSASTTPTVTLEQFSYANTSNAARAQPIVTERVLKPMYESDLHFNVTFSMLDRDGDGRVHWQNFRHNLNLLMYESIANINRYFESIWLVMKDLFPSYADDTGHMNEAQFRAYLAAVFDEFLHEGSTTIA